MSSIAARVARRGLVVAAACQIAVASSAGAQELPGRFEIAFGAARVGGISFGQRDATLTASSGGRYTLFSSDTSLEGATGVAGSVGVALSRVFELDARASYARVPLRSSLTSDAEQAVPAVISESVQQFIIGGALVAHLSKWTIGSRLVPFVSAGAGYLRDLHEGNTFAQTGQAYHIGGGVKWRLWAASDHRLKGVGLKMEANAAARVKGAALDQRVHVAPELAIGLFARF